MSYKFLSENRYLDRLNGWMTRRAILHKQKPNVWMTHRGILRVKSTMAGWLTEAFLVNKSTMAGWLTEAFRVNKSTIARKCWLHSVVRLFYRKLSAFSMENKSILYQQIFVYLQNNKYPDEFTKTQKRALRWRSQDFVLQDGLGLIIYIFTTLE